MQFLGQYGWTKGVTAVAGVLVVGLTMGGCGDKDKGSDKATEVGSASPAATAKAAQQAPEVVVATVGTTPHKTVHEFPAEVKSLKSIDVKARVEGYLENFTFEEGFGVKAGQVLFTIDDKPYVAALQSARAKVAEAKASLQYALSQVDVRKAEAELASAKADRKRCQQDVDRYRPLANTGVIATQTLDNAVADLNVANARVDSAVASLRNTRLSDEAQIESARAQVLSAEASVTQAELNLSYCVVTSPIDGVIGKLNVYPGNLVGEAGDTTPLVVISSLNPMYVNFSISESAYLEIMKLKDAKRENVTYELVLSNGKVFPHKGKFGMLDRAVNAKSGAIGLRTIFPNPDYILREGQFGKIRITRNSSTPVITIPQRAVTMALASQTVYVLDHDNKVAARTVEVGETVGQNVLINSGLKVGERIIVDGVQKVRPGMVVTPTTAEASEASFEESVDSQASPAASSSGEKAKS